MNPDLQAESEMPSRPKVYESGDGEHYAIDETNAFIDALETKLQAAEKRCAELAEIVRRLADLDDGYWTPGEIEQAKELVSAARSALQKGQE